jgi:hypothetical protein
MPTTKWEKGQSGNPAGKPKGTKNKETELKQTIKSFRQSKMTEELMEELWLKLSPKDKKDFITDLLPFVEAKKKKVDHTHTLEIPQIFLAPATERGVIDITPTPAELPAPDLDAQEFESQMDLDASDSLS